MPKDLAVSVMAGTAKRESASAKNKKSYKAKTGCPFYFHLSSLVLSNKNN